MDTILLLLTLILMHGYLWTAKITLNGPKYVRKGEDILLNCSSDVTPVGKLAEFLINGKTFTSLTRHSNGCLSAKMGSDCHSELCHCSSDGRTYRLKYDGYHNNNILIFTCMMKFITDQSFFLNESLRVVVLDIVGPNISVEGGFPLRVGMNSSLTCNVFTMMKNVNLTWNCLNITSEQYRSASRTFIKSKLQVIQDYHEENCTCTAQYQDYMTSTSIHLNVINPPLVEMESRRYCRGSSQIRLTCALSGELKKFGFDKWLHTVNGLLIRKIDGVGNNTLSVITIKSCSYQDAGGYTCYAWKDNGNGKYWANKITLLSVNDIPVIVKTYTHDVSSRVLSVQYYAHTDDIIVKWYKHNVELRSSTSYTMINAENKLFLDIYGIPVQHNGHIANLSINDTSRGKYTVVLINRFGEARHDFNLTDSHNIFHIRAIFLVLTGVIVFVLMSGVMSGILINSRHTQITMSVHDFNRSTNRPAIYYAAPEDENNMHTYNSTDPHYIEVGLPNSGAPTEYEEIDDDLKRLDNQNDINHDYLEVF